MHVLAWVSCCWCHVCYTGFKQRLFGESDAAADGMRVTSKMAKYFDRSVCVNRTRNEILIFFFSTHFHPFKGKHFLAKNHSLPHHHSLNKKGRQEGIKKECTCVCVHKYKIQSLLSSRKNQRNLCVSSSTSVQPWVPHCYTYCRHLWKVLLADEVLWSLYKQIDSR